ncbi:acyl-CoA N-acyltransferase [Pyrenochaeta sp. DS3sAY3a]|nr:acyl-CoA N-acyltransferase [Pyrenochaeta sp. DS3sAY3a]
MSNPAPFSSARLHYRAIRLPEDLPVFLAINEDKIGFQNSSINNIRLVSTADLEKWMKSMTEDCLLGAVIWLAHPQPGFSALDPEIQARKDDGEIIESWGTAIGEIHLNALPPDQAHHRWTEIGIDILPRYQGKGYGSEAIQWAMDYAFRRAGMHRIRIRGFEWNEAALKLYERLGFVYEGREREAVWFEGRWWDGVTMGLLEGEWWALQEGGK